MIIIQHKGLPLGINPSHIELIINNKEYALLYLSNKSQILTEIKYARFKIILPEYFVEINSPSMLKKDEVNYTGMINPKLISEIGWNKSFHPEKYSELLLYPANTPKFERWSEDNLKTNLDYINVVMFSGIYVPIISGLMEMIAVIEKKDVKELEQAILCQDTICT